MSISTQTIEPIAAPPVPAGSIPVDRLYRLSVRQYSEMVCAGILPEHDRVVLLEGLLVTKMGKNPPHVLAGKRTLAALSGAVPPGWHVAKEDPIATLDSVPEPDCTVLRGSAEDYRDRWPDPADVAMVIEVSDSSLKDDQTVMRVIYARAGLPIYWIVNIPDHRLEVYSDPTGPADAPDYRQHRDYGPDDDVPLVIEGREVARIPVRDLLP
jgi:Uma2 family endonuclease